MLSSNFLTTLRGKLSVWYLASMLSVVMLLSTLFSGIFWYTLHEQIDHHLHIVISEAGNIVRQYVGPRRDDFLKSLVLGKGMTVMLLSEDGTPLIQTNSPDVALISEHKTQNLMARNDLLLATPTHFTMQNIRFAAIRVKESPGDGILAVGYSLDIVNQTFRTLILILVAITVLILIPFSIYGFQRMKKHLEPLETLAKTMATFTSKEELTHHLDLHAQTVELRQIIGAFNKMITKIQILFASEQQFFSDAAHTLKTPLAVLRSQVEQLREKSTQGKMLVTIDEAVITVNDLLLLSRSENLEPKFTRFNLSTLLVDLIEITRVLAQQKDLKLTETVEANLYVHGDLTLFSRAISNLLHNAVDYTNHKGSINVTLTANDNEMVLTIQNSGKGLSATEQRRVFERFFRGKNVGEKKGSGLGLAITRSIVTRHHGQLKLNSKPAGPTKIIIVLPRV